MKDYKKVYDHQVRLMKELQDLIPETISGFEKMQRNHSMDSALSAKTKELIALGISISTQCEGCMITHLHHALDVGATRNEILEVLAVATMMGGAPALTMCGIALEAIDQYKTGKSPTLLFDSVSMH
ncbi:MAG: carboxymuconolactone decarboxylase family protein [Saprospiraceae bacterium]|nr:carboxymuconolactone decarboxylase family protein [Saprospiraceae bacterium]